MSNHQESSLPEPDKQSSDPDLETFKTLTKKLANPTDLIELFARIKRFKNEYDNFQLDLRSDGLYGIVGANQRIVILRHTDCYANLKRIANDKLSENNAKTK